MAYSYKGSISFGLVYIPVTLHSAVKDNSIGFNMIDKKTMSRVKYKKTCADCDGREVRQEDIVKGFEYEDGKYVIFENKDFDKLKSKKDKNITIEKFVHLSEVDPIYFDKPYYVVPTGAEKAFAVLLAAMEQEEKAAVAKTVLGTKETLILIRARDGQMLLNTLFFEEEITSNPVKEVRMIYDLYLKGHGFTKIAHELTKLKRRDASGTIKWDCTKVSRALHNATYMGYKCYLKSYRNNYLDQKSIVNRDESTHLYVKGDFEPIIPEETWYRCKAIRENRRIERGVKAGKRIITGVRPCNDVWVKKTVCKCGCHFRKDKWHRNKNGVTYGYKCYNVLNNGSRSSRINDGIEELDGFCDMGTIAGWKFDLMAYEIFRKLTLDFDSLLDEVYSNYVKNDTSEAKDTKAEIKRLTGVIQKEKMKLDNLTTMRMEGEITKEEYLDYKVKVTANIETTQKRIDKLQQEDLTTQGNSEHQFSKEELGGMLRIALDFTQPIVKRGIIDAFVRKIVAHSALEFDWYLNLFPHVVDSGFKEVTSFTIEYESAHSYREMRGEILRKYQYKNIVVHIYV